MSLKSKIFMMAIVLFASHVQALETDSGQPINIDSDNAVYDEKQQTSTYTGHVILTQGSIKVDGDKLVVFLKDGNVIKMIATGVPSHFRQLPAVGKEEIFGEGLTNEFYPDKNLLIFMNNASVKQGDATQSSDYIQYDTKNSLLKSGEEHNNSKRVHSVIKPKPKPQAQAH